MRLPLLSAALLALAAPNAVAQGAPTTTAVPDAARLAAARELMEAMRITDIMDATFRPMIDNMNAQMLAAVTKAAPEEMAAARARDPHFDERARRTSNVMGAELADFFREFMPTLLDNYANAYARVFTLSELRGQIAFYRSPIGQTVARKSPDLTVVASGEMMATMMPRLMERLKAIEPKLTAALADLPPPPAKPAA